MKWITVVVKLLALLLFLMAISRVDADNWDELQLSPNVLCAIPYGNIRVEVYEHLDNFKSTTSQREKKYFYKPIALLDHRSAISTFNDVTQGGIMRFKIHMWNEEIEKKIIREVSKVVDEEVQSHQVEVIYLEEVRLASSEPSSIMYSIPIWLTFQSKKFMWFSFFCPERSDCDQLAETMRTSPELFDHFQLHFSLTTQASFTKEIVLRVDSVVKGDMVASLLKRFKNKTEILLTADDEKKFLAESTDNAIMESFKDDTSNTVTAELKAGVSRKLKDLFISSSTSIKEQKDKRWESVFWNDDNYRPDKISKMLNDVYEDDLDEDEQNKLVKLYQNNNKLIASGDKSFEDLDKLLQKTKDYIEWDGEKFTPKLLSLSKINLSQLRDTHQLGKDISIEVHYTSVALSTPIRFDSEGNDEKRLFDLINRKSSPINEIEALVESGVNINCKNSQGKTPLFQLLEVSNGNTIDILRILLKNKVHIKAKNDEEQTALHVLCQNYKNDNIYDVALLLIENGVDVKAEDIYGQTALHLLCKFSQNNNFIDIARLLIQRGIDINTKNNGWTALMLLCRYYKNNNLKEVVQLLIENKVDVNAKNSNGLNALLILCEYYQHNNLNEIIKLLIENKVDVNAKTDDGWNALLLLCKNYHKRNLNKIVRLLIDNKVDINNAKNNGWTALMLLCRYYKNNNLNEIVRLLIENKVDVNAKNNDGVSALHLLCAENYQNENLVGIIRLFIQHGVDVNAKDGYGFTAEDIIREQYYKSDRNDVLKLLAGEK